MTNPNSFSPNFEPKDLIWYKIDCESTEEKKRKT